MSVVSLAFLWDVLKKLIKEKNNIIKLQDKEIDTLKGQIDLKELEIEMLKKA